MSSSDGNVKIASDLSSTISLNDGVEMPLFGLGTYLTKVGKETEEAVVHAIKNGYRMVDTAQDYRNEADVGRGLQKAGVKDIFVVTKVHTDNHGYEATVASVNESLRKLLIPAVDLFLVHSPYGGKNVETYRALLDLKAKGLIRSVGVSNFGVAHLEGLKDAGLPTPSVNQIEIHIYHPQEELVKYCKENNIAVMGYSPLARNQNPIADPDLTAVAKRHTKTTAQVMIRWSVQQGHITISKSSNFQRITENADVFDLNLSDDDLKQLSGKEDFICSWNPTVSPWEG